MTKLIKQGAEALIYLKDDKIIKERVKKNYRIDKIDNKLRKHRTKSEAKILEKASDLINVPKLLKVSEKDMKIVMQYIEGELLRDLINDSKDLDKLGIEIGKQIAKLHDNNLIHGDLTTANLILKEDQVYFVDFGLSFVSNRIEDRATDLHLFKQVIFANHSKIAKDFFDAILKGYEVSKDYKQTMNRFEKVEKRGRYKRKQQD